MNEREFNVMAEATLAGIESALERYTVYLDFDWTASSVLEIEIANGDGDDIMVVLNRNDAVREIWVAAPAGGFHFRHDGVVWRDTRDGEELLEKLAHLLSAYCGTEIVLE